MPLCTTGLFVRTHALKVPAPACLFRARSLTEEIDPDLLPLLHRLCSAGDLPGLQQVLFQGREAGCQDTASCSWNQGSARERWPLAGLVNEEDLVKRTPGIVAAAGGHLPMVRCLIEEAGADVRARDILGRDMLSHAAGGGNLQLVKYLLSQPGVDPCATDRTGMGPLHHAAAAGDVDMVQYLVKHTDVSVEAADRTGRTPLLHAAQGNHVGVAAYLVKQARAAVQGADREGRTALMIATALRHKQMVRGLGSVSRGFIRWVGRTRGYL